MHLLSEKDTVTQNVSEGVRKDRKYQVAVILTKLVFPDMRY